MSETNNVGEFTPDMANAGMTPANITSYRTAVPSAATGHVAVPTLPPRLEYTMPTQSYGMNQGYGGMGSYGMGGMGSYGMSGMGSYGMSGMGMGGYGGYGGMGGYGGYTSGYGMGGMGMNGYGNVESRFIQIAEENSRPAFESIQSLVCAVGGVSMMLENTFMAITSSFRAILGVAENFGRLRSLFGQFWTTFGMIRSINWLIRKLSVMLGIRTEAEFKAWAEAVAATQANTATPEQRARGSSWPILLFFGVIAAAPYILLKMMNGVISGTESLEDPRTWINPLKAVAQHSFNGNSARELSFMKDQVLKIAPKVLQGHLWHTGWLVGSVDGIVTGLVPAEYVKIIVPDNANQTAADANQKPEEAQNQGWK